MNHLQILQPPVTAAIDITTWPYYAEDDLPTEVSGTKRTDETAYKFATRSLAGKSLPIVLAYTSVIERPEETIICRGITFKYRPICEIFGVERARLTVHNLVHKADLLPEDGRSPDHVAVDPETNELLQTKLEQTRTNVIAHTFFTELRKKYNVDVVFLGEGATPLTDACNQYGLNFRYERHGKRNNVERVFRDLLPSPYARIYNSILQTRTAIRTFRTTST